MTASGDIYEGLNKEDPEPDEHTPVKTTLEAAVVEFIQDASSQYVITFGKPDPTPDPGTVLPTIRTRLEVDAESQSMRVELVPEPHVAERIGRYRSLLMGSADCDVVQDFADEVDRRIRTLGQSKGLNYPASIPQVTEALASKGMFGRQASHGLATLAVTVNQTSSPDAVEWVRDTGPAVLGVLDGFLGDL